MGKDVAVGDRTYTIANLSTFKVLRLGAIVTAIMREVPELSDEISAFTRRYRSENTVTITRAAAELRFDQAELDRISPEAWGASNAIELPASPGAVEIGAFVLPRAWDAAQGKVLDLLALLVTPNSELRDVADDEEALADRVAQSRHALMHEDAGQMLDLLSAAADVIEEQFSGKIGALRKVARLFGFSTDEEPTTEAPTTTSPSLPTPTSTDSPDPSDGPETNGSGSRTEPSSVSSTG